MKQATRDWLHQLNLRFYEEQAAAFSETRSRPWPGCARVLDALAARHARARVLDIGCGNGRLLPALQARFGAALDYTGLDASARLLALAQARHAGPAVRFVRADFLSEPAESVLPQGPFELVALFGVVHHVPGEEARAALLAAAATRVAPGGLLAYTLWRYDEDPRFARRSARGLALAGALLRDHTLEPGDHLLAFGERGLRYCHRAGAAEAERLLAATGLEPLARFHADAAPDAGGNDYEVLLRRADVCRNLVPPRGSPRLVPPRRRSPARRALLSSDRGSRHEVATTRRLFRALHRPPRLGVAALAQRERDARRVDQRPRGVHRARRAGVAERKSRNTAGAGDDPGRRSLASTGAAPILAFAWRSRGTTSTPR